MGSARPWGPDRAPLGGGTCRDNGRRRLRRLAPLDHARSTTTAKTTSTVVKAAAPKPLAVVPEVVDDGTQAEHLRLAIYGLRRVGASYVVLDFGITCLDTSSSCDGEGSTSPLRRIPARR